MVVVDAADRLSLVAEYPSAQGSGSQTIKFYPLNDSDSPSELRRAVTLALIKRMAKCPVIIFPINGQRQPAVVGSRIPV